MLALRLLSEGVEGPNTELVWVLYAGMAFFFLVILLGWWSASGKQDQVEVPMEAEESNPNVNIASEENARKAKGGRRKK
ncbi:MAG: hypothetical protein DPW18_08705 [Chloroflexi bacterium]|nr:hypothetical protein [Chloroflexota bacterium]MDL1941422.1 hypothetical protein [Chloroflexi bacterium CFX2]